MFNYCAVSRRTRNQFPLSFYPSLTISILSRLSLCLTFITIASDTSQGTRRGDCPLRGAIHVDYMNVFNPQYIRFVDVLSWALRCIGGDGAMCDAIVMRT